MPDEVIRIAVIEDAEELRELLYNWLPAIEAANAFIRCYIDAHVGKATEAQYLAAIETLRTAVEALEAVSEPAAAPQLDSD